MPEEPEYKTRFTEPLFQRIPVDKYGPIKPAPPLSVKIVAGALLVFALYGIYGLMHGTSLPIHDPELSRVPADFLRLVYLANRIFDLLNMVFVPLNILLAYGLLWLARPARIATIISLAVEFLYYVALLIMQAQIDGRTIIPHSTNPSDPSLNSLTLTLALCGVGSILLLIFGSMIVVLMDVDVIRVFEGRAAE